MTTERKTEHPHIVRVQGVCGGRPVVAGTRIGVDFIARFLNSGLNAAEILEMYPHLTPAGVHDAISYYFDHKAEIDGEVENATLEKLAEKYRFKIAEGRVLFDT